MKGIFIVLKKELIDCFRDKRSIFMTFFPMLIFPLSLSFYSYQIKSANERLANKVIVATDNQNEISTVIGALKDSGFDAEIILSDDSASLLKTGKVNLIIKKNKTGYRVIYNQNSAKSTTALNILSASMEAKKNKKIVLIFNIYGKNSDILSRYILAQEDISKAENSTNSLITVLGPMLIVMFIVMGGSSVAIDMFCGEKERGSLESLLATQISRQSLYIAKVMVVFIFVCFNTVISISG